MGNINVTFLPPQNWQDFEKLMKGVVDVIWQQEGWHNYGRQGQGQNGIDLYGYDDKRRFVGIQCKRKKATDSEGVLLSNSLLTRKLIEDEILNAESIKNPSLDRFIFSTTSSTDKKIQDIIREINHDRIKKNKFLVDIWFWEDIQVYLENHIELKYWYFQDLLEEIHKYDKNIHILTMLRQAFTRPAFRREIRMEESGADFIQAIKDTQEAIMTGRLYNRRGELLTTSYDYQKLTKNEWKVAINDIYNNLDRIRIIYQEGLLEKQIREHPSCLEVLDHRISDQFNKIRTDCLVVLNKVLTDSGLEKIKSELLRN